MSPGGHSLMSLDTGILDQVITEPFEPVFGVRAVAGPVLRHRIITTFNAESNGITPDQVIEKLLEAVPERGDGDEIVPEVAPAFST